MLWRSVETQDGRRWHRAGFRLFWRSKSQSRSGRPRVPLEIRRLIREMTSPTLSGALRGSMANFSSSASIRPNLSRQIHGKAPKPPSQGWKTFLRNHADGITSTDLFVVPTIAFRLLYGLLILRHDRGKSCGSASRLIRPPNGLRDNSPKRLAGSTHRVSHSRS